jgi:hypothetical protein
MSNCALVSLLVFFHKLFDLVALVALKLTFHKHFYTQNMYTPVLFETLHQIRYSF